MSSPIVVRSSDDHDVILGMINEASGWSLQTGKTPFCAVVINGHHGFKRAYFATGVDALNFIHDESKTTASKA